MITKFDYFNRYEAPLISFRKISGEFISFLSNIKNLNIAFEFNVVGELSFDVYKGTDEQFFDIYNQIEVKHQLFVEGIGYFIIRTVEVNDGEDGVYKKITAFSCEHELTYKEITYFDAKSKKFWNETNPSTSLMGMILDSIPSWSIGHIDTIVKDKSRTFDEPKNNIYSFLLEDVQDSYECIFDFDIINRIINVYDRNNYLRKTNIFLTRQDALKSTNISTNAEDIYTAFTLYGADEMRCSAVNPIGSATVYNFDYYKSKMSSGLVSALNKWETKIYNAEINISTYRTQLANKNNEAQTIAGEISSINAKITNQKKQLSANITDSDMIASINREIQSLKNQLSIQTAKETSINAEINKINGSLNDIKATCSFDNNFTNSQISELNTYIYEGSYVDDTFAFTNDMDYVEKDSIYRELYAKAKSMLKDKSIPTEELSINTSNFIFQKDFSEYTKELNPGVLIDVELHEGLIVSYVLLKMDVNFEGKDITLTFGNKYRSSNSMSLFGDWQAKVTNASNNITFNRTKYGKAVNSGCLDKMDAFMNSTLDLTLNAVKASDGQSFEITDSGMIGRRIDPITNLPDDEQIWLSGNNLLFTKDKWENICTAVGKLILPDGTEGYGINAEYLMGKWIIGKYAEISNESGSFRIDENGITSEVYDADIRNAINIATTALNSTDNSIDAVLANLTENFSTKEEVDSIILSLGNKFEQTSSGFEMKFEEMSINLDKEADVTQAKFDEINKYIRFEGGKILLGQEGNELELRIANDKIVFLQHNAEVAWFTNQILVVTDGYYKNSLKIGNFAFIPRDNGNLSFKKIT